MEIKCRLDGIIGHKFCYGSPECERCGWNQKEYQRRLLLLHHNGLTTLDNGLRCLVIEHKHL